MPYAQPPIGALRFQSPKPFKPGLDVVSADKFGAASVQNLPPYGTWIYPVATQQSEDCLTVNVWTPADAVKAPVIVWLHGGAWRTGATSMPLMDGHALAKMGVVVPGPVTEAHAAHGQVAADEEGVVDLVHVEVRGVD
jgi:para-nitrobenzyl esterase